MTKKLFTFIFLTLIAAGFCSAADNKPAPRMMPQLSADSARQNILDESADIKKLVLKYDAAPEAEKPAVRKEIEKLETQNEEARIKKQEERIKRQEDKIKELKKQNQERKKNIKTSVNKRVDNFISKDSVEKIKNESLQKKVADKVKEKK